MSHFSHVGHVGGEMSFRPITPELGAAAALQPVQPSGMPLAVTAGVEIGALPGVPAGAPVLTNGY